MRLQMMFWHLSYGGLLVHFLAMSYSAWNFRHIGGLFAPNKGPATKATIGLVLSSSIVSFLISFWAEIGKFTIFAEIILLALWDIYVRTIKHQFRFELVKISLGAGFVSLLSLISVGQIYETFSKSKDLLVNAHQLYFAGLPIEILKSDYLSRIKIFDNYPFEYGKFHFFNGSLSAILMAPSRQYQYIFFMIAKNLFLLILCLAVIELLREKNFSHQKSMQYIFLFIALTMTICASSVHWSLFTNNWTSVTLLLIALIALNINFDTTALIFILAFSISTSRSLLPGIGILVVALGLFRHGASLDALKANLRRLRGTQEKIYLVLIIFFLGAFAMTLSGYAPKPLGRKTLIETFTHPLNKIINKDWLSVMSPGLTPLYPKTGNTYSYTSQNSHNLFLIAVVSSLALIVFQVRSQKNHNLFFSYLALLAAMEIVSSYSLKQSELHYVLDYYVLPISIVLFLSPKRLRRYLVVFITISIVQILFLAPDVALPNWYIVEFVWVGLLVARVAQLFILSKTSHTFLYVAVISSILFAPLKIWLVYSPDSRDTTSHAITSPLRFSSSPKTSTTNCFVSNDSDMVEGLLGKRILYSGIRSDRYTVTRDFIVFKLKLETIPSVPCKN